MKVLEKYINFVGEKISYLIPVMVVLMIFVIVSRYFFGIGRTDIQELVMYFHALVFLGCAGYVMNHDEHVRVDIFYRNATKNYKQKINFILGNNAVESEGIEPSSKQVIQLLSTSLVFI